MKTVEFSIHQQTFCAQDDAQSTRRYKLFRGKPSKDFPNGRIWLVADQSNAADNVYAEGSEGSDGFGGATLRFTLTDGSVVSLKGPWKSGADALLKDTGHDVRDCCLTRGVVSFERKNGKWPGPDTFVDVVHYDDQHVLGHFDRIRDIAQRVANETGRKVYHAHVSHGGGHSGWCDPEVTQ